MTLPGHLIRAKTIEALRDVFTALARKAPYVLIVEHVHWIDKSTEEALACLIEALADVSLTVLLVYRPEYLHAWKQLSNFSEIFLGALNPGSTMQIAQSMLQHPGAQTVRLAPLSAKEAARLPRRCWGWRKFHGRFRSTSWPLPRATRSSWKI